MKVDLTDGKPVGIYHNGYYKKIQNGYNFIGDYYKLPNGLYLNTNDYFFKDNAYYLYIPTTSLPLEIKIISPTENFGEEYWDEITEFNAETFGLDFDSLFFYSSWNSSSISY
jgi:hypothetical protein